MTLKRVKDIRRGDLIVLPSGIGRVLFTERCRAFQSPGGCFRLHLIIVTGPEAGGRMNGQQYPGDALAEVA